MPVIADTRRWRKEDQDLRLAWTKVGDPVEKTN
jgi:hypothetical protein